MISALLHFTVDSVNELITIIPSLKNTEAAYNDFVAKNLMTSVGKYLDSNLDVYTEYTLSMNPLHIIDIAILNTSNDMFVVYEGKRLTYATPKFIERELDRFEHHTNISAYFLILYHETNDFEKYWSDYQGALTKLGYVIEHEVDVKMSNKIKVIKTIPLISRNFIPVYHIFANVNHEKEEIISQNRLKSISINRLKIFDNITVELAPHINILLGKNAFGKTSFLQALTLANIPDNYRLPYDEFIRQNYKEAEIILQRENEQDSVVQINEGGKTNGSLTKDIHEPIFLAYGTNIFSKYTHHNYAAIVEELMNGTKKWHYTQSIFEERDDSFYDPLGILNTLNETNNIKAKEIKDFIIVSLNQLLPTEFRIEVETKYLKSHYFVDKSNNFLPTNQLSEGYRNNVLLLTDIIIRVIAIGSGKYDNLKTLFKHIKGIIAIDEFDRHMHPSWQKSYIDSLSAFLPNIQFVLTTHNPVAILGRKAKEIQMFYYDEDNNISIKQLPETLSVDAGMVLLTHFDMDSILSTHLQQKVDTFYSLKTKDTLTASEQATLLNLQEQLDDTFIGVNIHDFRFLKFLEFLKDNGFDHRERLEELIISEKDVENFRNEFKEYYQ